jgi:hypothetical protein
VTSVAKSSGDHISLGDFVWALLQKPIIDHEMANMTAHRVFTEYWHLWTVFVPRRSITGRLVWGRVWRRRDRCRWIYKRFVEFDDRRTAEP